MSLARSLTSRMRARFEEASTTGALPPPSRAYSTKVSGANASKPIDRRLISLPTELLSTSNSLAYEAPDIKNLIEPVSPRSPSQVPASQPLGPLVSKQEQQQSTKSPTLTVSSSHSSLRSWDDGLASPHSPALTSASSITSNEGSREPSPSFMSKTFLFDRDHVETPAPVEEEPEEEAKPAVPQRSSLHTKQSHTMLARARSVSRQRSPRASVEPPPALGDRRTSAKSAKSIDSKHTSTATEAPKLPALARTSTDFFSSKRLTSTVDEHPFGAELAQVTELVEKYNTDGNGEPAIIDEETQYLIDHGFGCFAASDYIMEIQPLFHRAFGEPSLPVIGEWI